MKKTLTLTILAVMLALGANGAWAGTDGPYPTDIGGPTGVVTPNDNTGEIELWQAVNSLLGSAVYSSNAGLDSLEYTGNASIWENTGNGGYAVIGLGAGATNTLDVYNAATPGTLLNPLGMGFSGDKLIGNGTPGSPYVGVGSQFAPGTPFGFALNQNYNSIITTWYSNPNFNADGMDHIVVYDLSGTSLLGQTVSVYNPITKTTSLVTLTDPYLIGFEDLPLGDGGVNSDQDYNDLMFLVNGIAPVPEPMTLALFAFGLFVMIGFTLRRKFAFVS